LRRKTDGDVEVKAGGPVRPFTGCFKFTGVRHADDDGFEETTNGLWFGKSQALARFGDDVTTRLLPSFGVFVEVWFGMTIENNRSDGMPFRGGAGPPCGIETFDWLDIRDGGVV
jgi:hypothetical protein